MGLATIDSNSHKEHTEIHKILKIGVNRLVLTEIQRFKNFKITKKCMAMIVVLTTEMFILHKHLYHYHYLYHHHHHHHPQSINHFYLVMQVYRVAVIRLMWTYNELMKCKTKITYKITLWYFMVFYLWYLHQKVAFDPLYDYTLGTK